MARERLALWSLGLADSVTVRGWPGGPGQFQRYPLKAELVSDPEGHQLYLVKLGGRKRPRSSYKKGTRAAKSYRARYGRDPVNVRSSRIDPEGNAEHLGVIFSIRYTDQDGTLRHHDFDRPRPYLSEYENGQLWINGGSYRVTSRGIVG